MGRKKTFNEYKILDNGEAEFYITSRLGEEFVVKVSEEDIKRLVKWNKSWNASWRNDSQSYYICSCEYLGIFDGQVKEKIHYLHRWIFDYPEFMHIDHINHDTLDNRRCNLRLTEQSQNLEHRSGKNKNNKSGYRNVAYIKNDKYPYRVQLMVNGKNTVLGEFDDPHVAGAFAEEMRQKYYGKYKGLS